MVSAFSILQWLLFVYTLYVVLPQIQGVYLHPTNKFFNITNDTTSVAFTCVAHGASSYIWKRSNGSISTTAEGINSSHLFLHNISINDSDDYWCVAENRNGKVSSDNITLTVRGIIIYYIAING